MEQNFESPSLELWKRLIEESGKFKELAPWDWMWESDIFGVKNPATGEIGYCCVMGNAGIFWALAVYMGEEGLAAYYKIKSSKYKNDDNLMFEQNCLMASFEDRELLEKLDREILTRLNFQFSGRKSYPVFRRHLPGMAPYFLNKEEAEFLLVALRQTMEMSGKIKANPNYLKPKIKGQILLLQPGDGGKWSEEWVYPLLLGKKMEIDIKPYFERMRKIKESADSRGGAMELDFFYFPAVMEDEQRPYLPYGYLALDSASYFILDMNIFKRADLASVFPDKFLAIFERMRYFPEKILVKRDEAYDLIKPFADFFNIPLEKVKRLPAIADAKKSMGQFFEKPEF